jgi:hypothetical protein
MRHHPPFCEGGAHFGPPPILWGAAARRRNYFDIFSYFHPFFTIVSLTIQKNKESIIFIKNFVCSDDLQ